jgi:hypothetical protein
MVRCQFTAVALQSGEIVGGEIPAGIDRDARVGRRHSFQFLDGKACTDSWISQK